MNAIIRLTERERKRAVDSLVEIKRSDFDFVSQAITQANNYTGTLWHRAFTERDYILMGELQEKLVREYIEACGLDEEELSEAQGRKELGDGN